MISFSHNGEKNCWKVLKNEFKNKNNEKSNKNKSDILPIYSNKY